MTPLTCAKLVSDPFQASCTLDGSISSISQGQISQWSWTIADSQVDIQRAVGQQIQPVFTCRVAPRSVPVTLTLDGAESLTQSITVCSVQQ